MTTVSTRSAPDSSARGHDGVTVARLGTASAVIECPAIKVLFICTANQCRSPMAAELYRLRARQAGCRPTVASAGFLGAGVPVPEEVLGVMADRGVDLGSHRSQEVTPALVQEADLVITMTRQHLIEVAVMAGEDWSRCFTLTEAVQRAEVIGSPRAGEPPDRWVRQLHSGRTRAAILRGDPGSDVIDPMGGRRSDFEQTADRIDELVTRLVRVICPISASTRT